MTDWKYLFCHVQDTAPCLYEALALRSQILERKEEGG